MAKDRLIYIDRVKGIAMLLVILFHVARFLDLYYPDYHNTFINHLRSFDVVYNQFFLAVFFIVSGYFFRIKRISTFFISNIRTLLLPIFFITLILNISYGIPKLRFDDAFNFLVNSITTPSRWLHFFGNWFLGAIFWARLLVYPIYKYIKTDWKQWLVLFFLSFLGFIADLDVLNYMWIRQGLVFALYLKFGQWLSTIEKISPWFYFIYPISLVVVILLGVSVTPIGWTIDVSWWYYPIYLLLSLSGSILVISLCKKCCNKFFGIIDYIGRNSLVFYIINGAITKNAMKLVFKYIPNENELLMAISFVLAIVICNVVVGCIMSYIINTKYFRFIIGR